MISRQKAIQLLGALMLGLTPVLSFAHDSAHGGMLQLGFAHAAFSLHHLLIPFSLVCLAAAIWAHSARWSTTLFCAGGLGLGAFALI